MSADLHRRAFVARAIGALGAIAAAPVETRGGSAADDATSVPSSTELRDEPYWERIRSEFRTDPDYTWLSHGAGGAVPEFVLRRLSEYASQASTGAWDVPAFGGIKESGSSPVLRELLARTFGCDIGEIALTRNAMEGLATCLLGVDLRAGDEILTTTSDYDSCIAILKQREAREGVRVRLVDLPLPVTTRQAVVDAIEAAITPRTRVILVSHMTYGTGLILPVAEIAALARRHGILSIVDGAHSIGHLEFRIADIGCDCFVSCLHKWFAGPRGTGILYVRRERIPGIWPLFAPYSGKAPSDIEKFEECGTVSKAVPAVLPELFDFNARIGARAREARLRQLRNHWAEPLARHDRVRLWTSLDPQWSCGVAAFQVDGMEPSVIVEKLKERHRIRVRTLGNPYLPGVQGINVGATLVNSPAQLDRFVGALEELMREG